MFRRLCGALFLCALFISTVTNPARAIDPATTSGVWFITQSGELLFFNNLASFEAFQAGSSIMSGVYEGPSYLGNVGNLSMRPPVGLLKGGLYGVIVAEVAVAGYLTYQLVDASIDYYDASQVSANLDQQIAQRQDDLAATYGDACCCYRDPARVDDPADWFDTLKSERDCIQEGGRPLHCYNGSPRNPATGVPQNLSVPDQCAWFHRPGAGNGAQLPPANQPDFQVGGL